VIQAVRIAREVPNRENPDPVFQLTAFALAVNANKIGMLSMCPRQQSTNQLAKGCALDIGAITYCSGGL
jgi:hypothetical protein